MHKQNSSKDEMQKLSIMYSVLDETTEFFGRYKNKEKSKEDMI